MRSMVLLLFVAAGFAQNVTPESAHVRRIGQITLHGRLEEVFPLFGPVDEAKWAPGWEPSIKYGGNAELGTVFTTHSSLHPATWIVTRYDGNAHHMQYTVVLPEDRVEQLDRMPIREFRQYSLRDCLYHNGPHGCRTPDGGKLHPAEA